MKVSNKELYYELLKDDSLPKFALVKYDFPVSKRSIDAYESTCQSIAEKALADKIVPGMKIAITAGSRNIAGYKEILRAISDVVRSRKAFPYIVATMGSHGGATSEGQREVLKGYGITEQEMNAPVVTDMDVDCIGETEGGLPVFIDSFSSKLDGIIVVGRIKIHTDFRGPVESGLQKMLAIGLGKQQGAAICHKKGFFSMSKNIQEIAAVILKKKNILFGIGILEDAHNETYGIYGIPAEEIQREEPKLLEISKKLVPYIPFQKIDLLIVDEIGKNISGAGMDPNITGRSPRLEASPPFAERIVVLNISDCSHGAGTGIGNADVITKRAFDKFDFDMTYPNGLTSCDSESLKIPVVMPNDDLAIRFAIHITMNAKNGGLRVVWIKNTQSLNSFYISEALVPDAEKNSQLKIIENPVDVLFDEKGDVCDWETFRIKGEHTHF